MFFFALGAGFDVAGAAAVWPGALALALGIEVVRRRHSQMQGQGQEARVLARAVVVQGRRFPTSLCKQRPGLRIRGRMGTALEVVHGEIQAREQGLRGPGVTRLRAVGSHRQGNLLVGKAEPARGTALDERQGLQALDRTTRIDRMGMVPGAGHDLARTVRQHPGAAMHALDPIPPPQAHQGRVVRITVLPGPPRAPGGRVLLCADGGGGARGLLHRLVLSRQWAVGQPNDCNPHLPPDTLRTRFWPVPFPGSQASHRAPVGAPQSPHRDRPLPPGPCPGRVRAVSGPCPGRVRVESGPCSGHPGGAARIRAAPPGSHRPLLHPKSGRRAPGSPVNYEKLRR